MWTPAPSGIASRTFLAKATSSGGGLKTFLAMPIWTGCRDQAPTQPIRKAARNWASQPATSLLSPKGPEKGRVPAGGQGENMRAREGVGRGGGVGGHAALVRVLRVGRGVEDQVAGVAAADPGGLHPAGRGE